MAHRVVEISDDEIITKGDANNTADEPISREQVVGRVAFSIPLVGYLVTAIKTPIGTLVMIGLAVFLLELSFKRDKKKDEKSLMEIQREIEELKKKNTNAE